MNRRGAFHRVYGESALHLMAVIVTMAIAGYGFLRIFQNPEPLNAAIWFGGAILAHDVFAFPIYSGLNLVAHRSLIPAHAAGELRRVPAINHIRVPLMLSALSFLIWFPSILGVNEDRYVAQTGLSTDVYLGRWLLLSAVLMASSALLYALRMRRAGRAVA